MNYKDFENCGLKKSLDAISGKWKPMILYFLFHKGEIRFNDLWRAMPKVSKKVLIEHLKQMESQGLIIRKVITAYPPEVCYNLSEKGGSLAPILLALDEFGSSELTD